MQGVSLQAAKSAFDGASRGRQRGWLDELHSPAPKASRKKKQPSAAKVRTFVLADFFGFVYRVSALSFFTMLMFLELSVRIAARLVQAPAIASFIPSHQKGNGRILQNRLKLRIQLKNVKAGGTYPCIPVRISFL